MEMYLFYILLIIFVISSIMTKIASGIMYRKILEIKKTLPSHSIIKEYKKLIKEDKIVAIWPIYIYKICGIIIILYFIAAIIFSLYYIIK